MSSNSITRRDKRRRIRCPEREFRAAQNPIAPRTRYPDPRRVPHRPIAADALHSPAPQYSCTCALRQFAVVRGFCARSRVSDSLVRASTPRPNSPQTAAPRRDSNAHLDAVRKKPRTVIRITSAASKAHARPAVPGIASDQRVTWAPRQVNCCAMTSRKASPPVSLCTPPPQREECTARTRDKQVAADDRRDPSVFTFEPRAIAAFARETAARESHDTVTRDCASQRVHASRESIGGAHSADTATARAAHDSYELAEAYNRVTRIADSNYSFRLNIANSSLRNRRLARLLPRSSAPLRVFELAADCASHLEYSDRLDLSRQPRRHARFRSPQSPRTQYTPPMDPRDAAEIFSTAAFGFVDFRAACEVLRSCDAVDLVIRGLDAQFRRDIARRGCNSIRDFLRAHFAKLPETLRALYEYAIVECREAAPALTLSSSGRREDRHSAASTSAPATLHSRWPS